MITYYGYCDGSGEFYVVIDAGKCDSCRKCVAVCPQKALKMETMLIDLDDKTVAAVKGRSRQPGKTGIRKLCQRRGVL